jgi:small ligand-binding sensory domain FIST
VVGDGEAHVRCGDGLGEDADLVVAAEQAVADAVPALAGAAPDLAAVFACSPDPEQAEAALLRAAALTGARVVVGCNAPGVIGGGRAVEHASAVSVLVASLPGAHLRTFHLEVLRTSESIAVLGLPPQLPDDTGALLLADPYSFPVDSFVEQTADVLPGLAVSGGLATGPAGAGSTRLLVDGRVHDRGAVGVTLGGRYAATALVSHGCRPVGPVMTVTAAEGNELRELAGVPATTKLEALVADLPPEEQALVTGGLLIGVAMDEYADEHAAGDFLVRGLVGADPARGALVVGDVVPVGRTVQFQVRDADTASDHLRSVLAGAYDADVDPPAGALLFSCTGRGADFFTSSDHDPRAVRAAWGGLPVAGFFAAGEIGPVGGRIHLHSMAASLLAFDRLLTGPPDLPD